MKNNGKNGKVRRIWAAAMALALALSVAATAAFADDLMNTVPSDEGYTNSVTTFNDDNGACTNDTIVGQTPYSGTNVRQSTSPSSASTFAAGMPLSTIYIDQDKVKDPTLGKFYPLPSPYSQYLKFYSDSGKVNYDAVNGPKKLYANTLNELEGDLYYVIFPNAAILPDGTKADLKITYSNAKIVIDQRYAIGNMPYNGEVFLTTGGNFSYGGTDTTNIANLPNASDRQDAVNNVVRKFYSDGTADFSNGNMRQPMIGKTMDATYQIVNKNEVPIEGTFIYAITGINLDRDPYRGGAGAGSNYGKPLWYIGKEAPESFDGLTDAERDDYHFFSESMVINAGQASQYIYVRSNNNSLDDTNQTASVDQLTHYYSQVRKHSSGKTQIIGNAWMNTSGVSQASDTSYCSGFVTLADAAAGFKVTAGGHGGTGNSAMNTNTFQSKTIWYRYTSSTGPHGNIEITSEGNYNKKLTDGGTVLGPGTYVVTEGKTVTYTMTPEIGYKIKDLHIIDANGKMQEVKFDNESVSKMKKGDTVTVTTAAGKEGVLKYEMDGTYSFIYKHAEHDEKIHVEWEPTTADILVAKVWDDSNDKDGMRELAYSDPSTTPKFKLQSSINGGRTWEDVTINARGEAVTEQTVPSGKDDDPQSSTYGKYLDGIYTINNDNSGYNHPYTWQYLPIYTYDGNGTMARTISYRIVELPDAAIQDYKKAQYYDTQSFELTSEETKSWEGWQIYEDSSDGKHYGLRGDDQYYEVTINNEDYEADGIISATPADPQPDKDDLSPISSVNYRTVDRAIPYQSVDIKNEHDAREIYVDVTKEWDDDAVKDETTTSGVNEYARRDLKFVLHGETEDGAVDLNGSASGKDLELLITTSEADAKIRKLEGYVLYKDGDGNQYAKVTGHATYPDGYYPVTGGAIDYSAGAAAVEEAKLKIAFNDTYKIDDDHYGAYFDELPTHDGGKPITYTVTEKIEDADAQDGWSDAGSKSLAWTTTGGGLSPVRDSANEVEGYTGEFINTPTIDNVYETLPMTIKKRDAKTKGALEGAEFTVYLNAVNGTKPLDDRDTKVEGQQIYTDGTNEYVLRVDQSDQEKYYYTFADDGAGGYTYTKEDPQPEPGTLSPKKSAVESTLVTTDLNGQATIKFLEPGTYYVQETKAPEGYQADPTIYEFIVDRNLKSIRLKDVDDGHQTKWWEKLYDLLFHDGVPANTNWEAAADRMGGTLTIDDDPLTSSILVRKFWEDNDDQDGVRPQNGDPKMPKVVLQWTTGAHMAEGHPVYTNGTDTFIHDQTDNKYYKVIREDTTGSFEQADADPQPKDLTETQETCEGRTVYKDASDVKYVIAGGVWHRVTDVDSEGEVSTSAASPQPKEADLELVMDAGTSWQNVEVPDDTTGDPTDAKASVTYAGGPVLTHQHDAYTWNSIPAYRDGKKVTFRIAEESVLLDNDVYEMKFSHTSETLEKVFTLVDRNGQGISTHNQTVDVTNKHETQVINIEAYKTWNDDDRTKRREATVTLYKTVNGATSAVTKLDAGGHAVNDTGTVPTSDETDPVKVWKDLPVYEGGYPITYRIEETTIDGYKTVYEVDYTKPGAAQGDPDIHVEEEGDAIDSSVVKRTYYTQADEDAGTIPDDKRVGDESTTAAFRIENDETIDIEVEKTWIDGANANVTFELWRTTTDEADLTDSAFKEGDICYQNNENGNRISVQDYENLPASEQAKFTVVRGSDWSPKGYALKTDPTQIITRDEYDALSSDQKLLYEEVSIDGWKKVDEHEFAASQFLNLSTGDSKTYTFEDLPRQEVETVDGQTVYTDGTTKYVLRDNGSGEQKYYTYTKNGSSWNYTEADPQPRKADLHVSYQNYLYRVLETPRLVRFAADQTSNTKVTDYNVHASNGIANVVIVKELDGRSWLDSDKFFFEMEPVSASDMTDGSHSISTDDIPLPQRLLRREVYEDASHNRYVLDANGYYRLVTEEGGVDVVAKRPANPQPKADDLTATGDSISASCEYPIADAQKSDLKVGAIGRAVEFLAVEFGDEGVVPRGHTVEFNYKVYEVYDGLGTSLDEATDHTGVKDGITYAGERGLLGFEPASHDLKITVTNDANGKMATAVYWDGASQTGAIPVYTNEYDASAEISSYVIKKVMGREIESGDAFNFTITNIGSAPFRTSEDDAGSTESTAVTDYAAIDQNAGTKVSESNGKFDPEDGSGGKIRALKPDLSGWIRLSDLAHKTADGKATDTFIYEITENPKNAASDPSRAKDDDLTMDGNRIYMKIVATDNQDGTLKIEQSYHSNASCSAASRLDNSVLVSSEDGSIAPAGASADDVKKVSGMTVYEDAGGNRYVRNETDGKYYKLDENEQIADDPEENDPEGLTEVKLYEYAPAALFTNTQTIDIPVVKEWVGGPAIEDVTLRLMRKLIPLSEEEDLTYETAEASANKWMTVGLTYYAERGDFVKEDGTPDYDDGSDTTASETYQRETVPAGATEAERRAIEERNKELEDFNLSLPKYVTQNGTTYRAVYKLAEDDTSDAYKTTYRSRKDGEEDTKGNRIHLDGETLVVTNTVAATNVARPAAVKQLLGRRWLESDKFDFTLEAAGKGAYNEDGSFKEIDGSADAKAKVPMPERYVNKNDEDDVISVTDYKKLSDEEKEDYEKQGSDDADAVIDDTTVDPNGNLERLARFDEIEYEINDLVYNKTSKLMQGDFFYVMKEKIPDDAKNEDGVAYSEATAAQKEAGGFKKKGITYDGDEHTVHVQVGANRTGELQVQIAYDEDTVGDITTGTQFTPVYTNKYDAETTQDAEIRKYVLGRKFQNGETFTFEAQPLGGAPFADENGDTIESGKVVKTITADTSVTTEYQSVRLDKLHLALSDLTLTVGKNGAKDPRDPAPVERVRLSDLTTIATEGMKYGRFVYAITETAASAEDLEIDADTDYARMTVIDKGDGVLDSRVEYFEDRFCLIPRYEPGTQDEDDGGDGTKVPAKAAVYVNRLQRDIKATKAWANPATSDVTLKLQWTINDGANWYNVADTPWMGRPDGTKIIKKEASGDDLTVTWNDLPAYANYSDASGSDGDSYDLNDKWIKYRITEEPIDFVDTRYNEEPYEDGDEIDTKISDGQGGQKNKYTEPTVGNGSPFMTEEEKDEDEEYVPMTDQLYVTNFRKDIEGKTKFGVVKQYIGKVWENEEFTFRARPLKSALGDKAELSDDDPDKYTDYDETTNKMPTLANDTAKASRQTSRVSVNERSANFGELTIRLSDLEAVTRGDNKGIEKGIFLYEIKEVIPSGAVKTDEVCGKDADGNDLYYYAAKDENGNLIKYTTEAHTVKIVAVDNGNGKIETTVSYDDRETGQFVPVYTNYAMLKTPVEGTKTWIGGKKNEHVNGTVTLEDGKITASTDRLGLKLKRKLNKSGAEEETLTKDDAGRTLELVWVKEIAAVPPTWTGNWVDKEDPDTVISDDEYQALPADEKDNYEKEMTDPVPAAVEKQEGESASATGTGNSGPYTYTVKAKVTATDPETQQQTVTYEDPLLNTVDEEGYEYDYFIEEGSVPANYDKSEKGLDVTNRSNVKDKLKVTKTWADDSNAEGLRPASVTVHLYKIVEGGSEPIQVEVARKVLQKASGDPADAWTTGVTWDDLDVYDENGDIIKYVVIEESVAGYTTKYAKDSTAEDDYKSEGDEDLVVELDGNKTADPQYIDVKNTLTPATHEVKVSKKWDDHDDVDGKRPGSGVQIALYQRVWDEDEKEYGAEERATYADGRTVPAVTLDGTADTGDAKIKELAPDQADPFNKWNAVFGGIPKTKNGKTVIYYVKETTDLTGSGYEAPVVTGNQLDGYTVLNKREQDVTSATITKVWADNSNALNTRPDTLDMELWRVYEDADGNQISEKVTANIDGLAIKTKLSKDDETAENKWAKTYERLPKNIAVAGSDPAGMESKAYTYYWKEKIPTGYTAAATGDVPAPDEEPEQNVQKAKSGEQITNTFVTGTLTVTKFWDDAGNEDRVRPSTSDLGDALRLFAGKTLVDDFGNAPKVKRTVTAGSGADKDKYFVTYENLPVYDKSGQPIQYRLEESPLTDYTLEAGPTPNPVTLRETGTNVYAGTSDITNKHIPGTTSFTFNKVWDDANDADGKRPGVAAYKNWLKLTRTSASVTTPEDVTAEYTGNVKAIANNDGTYTYSWTGLDKYDDDANEYTYTIEETVPATGNGSYYQAAVSAAHNADGNAEAKAEAGESVKVKNEGTITNKQIYKDLEVVKVWNDKIYDVKTKKNIVNPDRPESIKVTLTGDDSQQTAEEAEIDEDSDFVKGSYADDTFTYLFEKVRMYDADGDAIEYEASEDAVKGYDTKYINVPQSDVKNGIIVNTYMVTRLTGTKVWKDGNKEHNNAEDVQLTVKYQKYDADGNKVGSAGTVQDPKVIWGTGSTKGQYTVAGLPVSDADGNTIVYWAEERSIYNYETTYSNTDDADTAFIDESEADDRAYDGGTITNTMGLQLVMLYKEWSGDNDNEHDTRKATKINLYKKVEGQSGYQYPWGELVERIDVPVDAESYVPLKVWADIAGDDPALPAYENGKKVTYTFGEHSDNDELYDVSIMRLADSAVSGSGNTISFSIDDAKEYGIVFITFENRLKQVYDTLKVTKTWDDAKDAEGLRPEKVTVHLYKEVPVSLSEEEENEARESVDAADFDKDGEPGLSEEEAAAYREAVEEAVENALKEKKNAESPVQVEVVKKEITRQGSETDSWTTGVEWKDLPVYNEDGTKIKYIVTEESVAGYRAKYAKDSRAEGDYKDEGDEDLIVKLDADTALDPQYIDIKNSLTPATDEVKVTKVWDDDDDVDGKRPPEAEFELYKYVWDKDAEAYKTEAEKVVKRPATAKDVAADPTKELGDDIAVTSLKLNGVKDDPQNEVANEDTPEDANTWKGSWINLPLTENGKTVLYIVKEKNDPVSADYEKAVITGDQKKGFTVTNKREQDVTSASITKIWDDDDDIDGRRPETLTVELWRTYEDADGDPVYEKVDENIDGLAVKDVLSKDDETAANKWEKTYERLPKNTTVTVGDKKESRAYTYYWKERIPAGYTASATGNVPTPDEEAEPNTQKAESGKQITNALNTELVITKKWVDAYGKAKAADGSLRPGANAYADSLKLFANDTDVTADYAPAVTDNEDGTYTITWTGLPRYANDEKQVYSVKEDKVTGYDAPVYDNSANPDRSRAGSTDKAYNKGVITNRQLIKVDVVKTWNDNNDHDGQRPDTIKVTLYQNGVELPQAQAAVSGNAEQTLAKDDAARTDNNNKYTWTAVWKDLPYADENGVPYNYTATETALDDHYTAQDNRAVRQILLDAWKNDTTKDTRVFTIENKDQEDKISFTVDKIWNDRSDEDGLRPETITYKLYQDYTGIADADKQVKALPDGASIEGASMGQDGAITVTVNKSDKTQGTIGRITIKGLPAYADKDDPDAAAKPVTYSIVEDAVRGYNLNDSGDAQDVTAAGSQAAGFTVTNVREPKTEEIKPEVIKKITGRNFRPGDEFTFLIEPTGANKDIAPTPTPDWVTWKAGVLDALSKEKTVPLGTFAFDGSLMKDKLETGDAKTFTYKVTEKNGGKVIDDLDYDDSEKTLTVTLTRKANGDVEAAAKWGEAGTDADRTFTNEYGDEVDLTLRKVWIDEDGKINEIEIRPEEVTFTLTAEIGNDEGVWADDDDNELLKKQFTKVNDKKYTKEFKLKKADATEEDNIWQIESGELPKYDAEGEKITYSVSEEKLPNYQEPKVIQKNNVFTVTNEFEDNYFTIPVVKKWDDENNEEGKRPDEITVSLKGNGNEVWVKDGRLVAAGTSGAKKIEDLTLSEENNWKSAFTNVPKTDAAGDDVSYTVVENDFDQHNDDYVKLVEYQSASGDWTTDVPDDWNNKVRITNSNDTDKIRIEATKKWTGESAGTGKSLRTDVILHLLGMDGDGLVVYDGGTKKIVKSDAAAGEPAGTAVWKDVPKRHFKDEDLTWKIIEEPVFGYTASVSEITAKDGQDGVYEATVTNKYTGPETEVSVTKEWKDTYYGDGYTERPESITYELWRKVGDNDPEKVEGKDKTVTEDDDWKAEWKDLPVTAMEKTGSTSSKERVEYKDATKYRNKTDKKDVITESEYNALGDECKRDYEPQGEGYAKKDGSKQISASEYEALGDVCKNDYEAVTVQQPEKQTESVDDAEEVPILYTVKEVKPGDDYEEPVIESVKPGEFKAVNIHKTEIIDYDVRKVWNDNNDVDGLRPDHVTVKLMKGTSEVRRATVTEDDNWEHTFVRLPATDEEGKKITYTIEEIAVDGYTTTLPDPLDPDDVNVITNTHAKAELIDLTAVKVWEGDEGDKDTRKNVTLHLLRVTDGSRKDMGEDYERTLTFDPDDPDAEMKAEWKDLRTMVGGKEVSYTVVEDPVPKGYRVSVGDVTKVEEATETENAKFEVTVTNKFDDEPPLSGDVIFVDPLEPAGKNQMILRSDRYGTAGQAARAAENLVNAPADPKHAGVRFVGWDLNHDALGNYVLVARYSDIPAKKVVTYVDGQAKNPLLKSVYSNDPSKVKAPKKPSHSGLQFVGWKKTKDKAGNTIYVAKYKPDCSGKSRRPWVKYIDPATGRVIQKAIRINKDGTEPKPPKDPKRKGYTFTGWTRTVDANGNVIYKANWAEYRNGGKNPKTGDDARLLLWGALVAAALITLIVVLVMKHKRANRSK